MKEGSNKTKKNYTKSPLSFYFPLYVKRVQICP